MIVYKSSAPELFLKKADGSVHKAKILSSKDAYDYFMVLFNEDTLEVCESFIVIFLNRANITCGYFRASHGGISGTVVDPRLIFKKALDCYASVMILAHNHPSGNAVPSEQDITLTKKMTEAGKFLEIKIVDHLIVTPDKYYSFADEGKL